MKDDIRMRTQYLVATGIVAAVIIGGVGIGAATFQNQQARIDLDNQSQTRQSNDRDDTTEILAVTEDEVKDESEQPQIEIEEDQTLKKEISKEVENPPEDIQKSELTPKAVEVPVQEPVRRSYTNPYFPGFKLSYNDSWSFNTKTESLAHIGEPEFVARETTLTKGNTTISVFTFPSFITGCGGDADKNVTKFTSNLSDSGLARYDTSDGKGDFYAPSSIVQTENCFLSRYLSIRTNISGYNIRERKNSTVEYWAYVTVEGAQHLEEADLIVGNSTIQTLPNRWE